MLSTIQETPVVKAGGNVENIADEIILAQSAFVLYNSENLSSSNRMLHLDAGSGDFRGLTQDDRPSESREYYGDITYLAFAKISML